VGHESRRAEPGFDETGFTQRGLVVYCAIYLSMLALCSGICVPAGMFMPAVMLGAASGLAAGVKLQHLLPNYHIQPGALPLPLTRPPRRYLVAHAWCAAGMHGVHASVIAHRARGVESPQSLARRCSCGYGALLLLWLWL
jgi:H+/Cl- antiporter ClcA